MHPLRPEVPIFLAAEGPKNVALAAEIADGWLPLFFSPKVDGFFRDALAEGFGRPGARHTLDDFEVAACVPVLVHDDVEQAADFIRPMLALYIGGMGAKGDNFHRDVFARLGYEADVRQDPGPVPGRPTRRTRSPRCPPSMVEDVALMAPPAKIRDELPAWEETVITTLLVQGDVTAVRKVAELFS